LLFNGTKTFREAAAIWYEQKFGISVNPETEVLPLIGSQEGTAHLPLAVLNPGDFCFIARSGLSFPRGRCLFGWGANLSDAAVSRKSVFASI
jgi:Aspartate/tyrosine/aromatic aminotransferase